MDQQGVPGLQPPTGRGGQRLHIAHRRSPSELTPLMMEQLAIQQQIEALQQQQQQIAATHQQYVNMGMIPPGQQMPGGNAYMQNPAGMTNMSPPQPGSFQFPQQFPQQQQQMGMPIVNSPQTPTHRRNQSAMPGMGLGMTSQGQGGPPPAPSSGASGSNFTEFNANQSRENVNPRGGRGGGGGHARRHSLALDEAKKAAELAESKRKTSGFQFPIPGGTGQTSTSPTQTQSPGSTEPTQPTQGSLSSTQGSLNNRGGATRTASHGRSQSMAVGNGRGTGQARGGGSFQFPAPDPGADFQRRGSSGHGRSASRNFEGNWRQQNTTQGPQDGQQSNMGNFQMNQNQAPAGFQPGHRPRGMNQSVNSIGSFQYPNQPQLIQLPQGQVMMGQPQMYGQQQGGLNQLQLAQLQALQTAQANGQPMPGLQGSQHAQGPMSAQQQQQQQRKTLFTPYLPQATLPALLSDGQLVAGTLRVNKKNRSDAYVTTTDLDADIFICGSKDRNRALEGDLVAIELLDVDDVWGQKREKEEKKKRKDITDNRNNNTSANDATTAGDSNNPADGSIRRRGSLRQRPTQKKNDDVEVEGQSLLLMEEEEISDEQKPLYAGHVVAVIERMAGQMFSGTLGLLRPSSQATKEKQEAERQARDGNNKHGQSDRQQDKPKIVWFKPTDKRVPLIAIPTEQAPRDFVEKHQDYANRIFVACIKRWPITSLHPFGTLVEQLGEMGDLKVETDALLRDNNFGPDDFSDAVLKSVGFEEWSVENDGDAALQGRRDFRSEQTFTIDPNGAKELDDAFHFKTLADGNVEIGIHVADVAHFIKANSLVDREARKRGTGVYLMNRTVNMLPARLSTDICCLLPDQERYTVSVVFKVDPQTGKVSEDDIWVGKSLIKSSGKLAYDEVDAVLKGNGDAGLGHDQAGQIRALSAIAKKFRQTRFGDRSSDVPPLRLFYQLDDENVPVEQNIFDSSPAHELIEELSHKTNEVVAKRIYEGFGEKAWLRRQLPPNQRRIQTIAERMGRLGYEIDTSSSGALQNSLFKVEDADLRKGMETLLIKSMQRAKYCVAGKTSPEELAHYVLNVPLYTHFTNPSRRYADIMVHRQLEATLLGKVAEFQEDLETLVKAADGCNTKKDSAQSAQEQSVHIESCRIIDRHRNELGGDLICEGVVLCVYESAFDVLIPEYGFEKRVHCDQLPLKKAEFDKNERVLELYWEKGVPSSAYIPEDERSKPGSMVSPSVNARQSEAAARKRRESEERRRQLDTSTMSPDDTDALFDDDEDGMSELTESTAGVSLNPTSPDMTRSPLGEAAALGQADIPETKLTDKDNYLKMFKLREEGGNYIQDVTEMVRVPVILKTDLTKSPPCLTIRSVNPYAL